MDTDVEPEEQLDDKELAKQDPTTTNAPATQTGTEPSRDYVNEGIAAAEKHANSGGGGSGLAEKAKGSFTKKNKWKLIAGGGGAVAVLGAVAVFFFFFLLFKNVHIEHLFMDYRMAKLNQDLHERLKTAIDEAKNPSDPAARPAGNESTPAPDEATATPEQEMAALNPDEINTLSTATPEQLSAASTEVSSVMQSVESDGAQVDTDLNIERSVKEPTTADETEANKNTESELSTDSSIGGPPDPLKNEVDDAKKLEDGGLSAEDAATKAIEDSSASGSQLFSDSVEAAQGPFIIATYYCMLKDIWDSVTGSLQKVLATGAANVAASTAKTADCQKLGDCSATTIGALANRSDNSKESFTNSCGSARASQGDTTKCKELPKNYWIGQLPLPDNVKDSAKIIDKVANPPLIGGGIGAACGAILSPAGQIAAAGLGVVSIILSGGTSSISVEGLSQTLGIVFGGVAGKALAVHLVMDYGGGLFKNIGPVLFGNLMDMGSKSIASDTCRQAGCQPQTDAQLHASQDLYRQEKIALANKKGFFYKFLSPDNEDSVTVRVALNTPTNPTSVLARTGQMMATLFSPQKFAALFSSNWLATVTPAYAAATEPADLYGFPSYGRPNVNEWGILENSKWVQSNGGVASFKSKYGKCFTEPFTDAIKDADCKSTDPGYEHYGQYVFDVHLLHNVVLRYNNQTGGTQANAAASGSGTTPTGNSQQLAQQILASPNLVQPAGRLVIEDLTDASQGKNASGGKPISNKLLQFIATLVQNHQVYISSIEAGGTGHSSSPDDPHYNGLAVDIAKLDGAALTGRDPNSVIIINVATGMLPPGSAFGQSEDPNSHAACGPQFTFPAGFTELPDYCNHIHIQVPVGTP